jgi:hypothetical protein
VTSYTVDLATQKVVVKGTISYDDVLAKLKKTGKEASFFIFYRDVVNCLHNITLGSIGDHYRLTELYFVKDKS